MKVNTPSLKLGYFISNYLYWKIPSNFVFNSSWYNTPKTSLKRKIGKKLFLWDFPRLGHPSTSGFPLATVSADQPPKVFQPFGWRSIAYLPGPLIKGLDKCPFCIRSHYKSAPFRNIFQFSKIWNLVPSRLPS